ncbi:MAG: anti-sigma factor domain-containing protein [Pyrinomonadaceae bacterium]
MNEEKKEKMLNLLADRAIFGLNETETAEFEQLAREFPALASDNSFELATAAVSLLNLDTSQSLPANLNSKILAGADKYFASAGTAPEEYQKTFAFEPKRSSIWKSLGWLVAALACIALLVNIWLTRGVSPVKDIGKETPPPTVSPVIAPPSSAEQREQLLASAGDVIEKNWTDYNPKEPRHISGDVVWSNSLQKGFVRFHNLPVNDKTRETYQLWVFDKTQEHPVDGGVFNVDQNGDVIVPIDVELRIKEPKQFAVTAEKPGGVVVSKLGKVMAIAKV